MRNHLGSFECKLCLTLHNDDANYLAHTQGRRHQQSLVQRAARDAKDVPPMPLPYKRNIITLRKTIKIGRPGYQVIKQYDPDAKQRSLLFQIEYPEIEDNVKPRHRFMSSFEQRVQSFDPRYQYLLFAVEPYEAIVFKVPSSVIDKSTPTFFSHWNPNSEMFMFLFKTKGVEANISPATAPAPAANGNLPAAQSPQVGGGTMTNFFIPGTQMGRPPFII